MGLVLLLQIFITACYFQNVICICSTAYGAKPCPYVPSPPGETPPCAKAGLTYCEYPEHYPRELIYHLLEKWKYDHRTLLLDESKNELGNFFVASETQYKGAYGVPHQSNVFNGYYQFSHNNGPQYNTANTYIPSPRNITNNLRDTYSYPTTGYQYPVKTANYNNQYYYELNTQNDWSKWNARNNRYYRRKRSLDRVRKWYTGSNFTDISTRNKRQSNGGQTLCASRSQYIMPRAALNSKGDWMYVVNVPEVDNRYTQLVKSEICVSQQCSGLCSLPNGYSSRCEQKYVQKRLVAVEATGSQLYSDIFWFPSCCICTINNN